MELNQLINENENFIDIIKNEGIHVINYNKNLILKYPYNYNNFDKPWKLYCKGAVINKNTKKILCIPPIKSSIITDINDIFKNNDKMYFQDLIDGTMINLFYDIDNEKWELSTRSNIGGNNKYYNKKFKILFNECGGINIDYNLLNKSLCYSFVLLHKKNRNVSKINKNTIILVDVFNLDTLQYMNDLSTIDISVEKINTHIFTLEEYNQYITNIQFTHLNYNYIGYILKYNNKRFKAINPHFTNIVKLKNNIRDLYSLFSYLYINNNVYNYLQYYPEHTQIFKKQISIVNIIKYELYDYYKKIYITKELTINSVPYQLKPCIYDIHKDID